MEDADVIGDEPIFYKGEIAGWSPQAGMPASGVSMAMGYVRTELAEKEDGWSVELLAEMLSQGCKNSLYLTVTLAVCAAKR